jgi:glycerol-3-phosphate O-acyltransferase
MGAYFSRRDSRNPLYRRVLSRYVRLATAAGVTQAVFPEGGLSRTGALQPPKLGLLAYIASAIEFMGDRDIVFVPVGVNYDRVLEDRVLISAAATPKGERPRFAFKPGIFARFVGCNVWDRLTSDGRRNGYACISFGRPVSLNGYLRNRGFDFRALSEADRFGAVERLGDVLISEIGRAVPALPASLVAYALLEAEAPVSEFELKGAVHDLMRRLERAGSPLYIPRADQEYAIDFGLRMLIGRNLIVEADGLLRPADAERVVLCFYANALVHHLGRSPWPITADPQPA